VIYGEAEGIKRGILGMAAIKMLGIWWENEKLNWK
jgi:hypothetical protein